MLEQKTALIIVDMQIGMQSAALPATMCTSAKVLAALAGE